MNFLSSLAKGAGGDSTDDPKKTGAGEEGSTAELFASAKVLAEAAQSQFNKDNSSETDNKKVAEAAADILGAAQKYGKLDETQGIGQYVEKAETYLHQYGAADPPAAAAEKPPAAVPESGEAKPPAPEETKAPAPADKVEKEEGGNASDYLQMAGDFLGKK